MSDEPEGWAPVRLEQVCRSLTDGDHQPPPRATQGIPFVTIGAMNTGRLDLAKATRFVPRQYFDSLKEDRRPSPGDVLYSVTGSIGIPALVEGSEPFVFQRHIAILKPNPALILSRFLRLRLESADIVAQSREVATGSAQLTIPLAGLRSLSFALPPLAEQRRIVARVEELLAEVNAAKQRLAKVPGVLKRFRQAVLAAACAGKLTEDWRATHVPEPIERTLTRINVAESRTGRAPTEDVIPGVAILSVGDPSTEAPPGWKWVPLTDVAKLESGHTPSRKHASYWNGAVPWIGIVDAGAHHGRVIHETAQTVTQAGLDNSAARLLPARTVCLSRTASVGYVVIMGRPMATSQDFVNWVCSEALVPEFLMYAVMAEGPGIKRFGRGSTHTTIYFPEVKALHICLPPVDEQHEIVRRVAAMLPIADRIARAADDGSRRVELLPQAILARAFRGELASTEADLARAEGRDYETAEQLLARVLGERASDRAERGAGRLARPRRSNGAVRDADPDSGLDMRDEPDMSHENGAVTNAAATPFAEMDDEARHAAVFAVLWPQGPLEKDAAVRLVAEHLRHAGHLTYQRLRADGPLYATVVGAIESAIKAGVLDRPRRGYVRAIKDALTMTADDWRYALVTCLDREPVEREDAIRRAAEWARDNLGVAFERLRADGNIVAGLRSAINSAVRRGEVMRHGAKHIARVVAPTRVELVDPEPYRPGLDGTFNPPPPVLAPLSPSAKQHE